MPYIDPQQAQIAQQGFNNNLGFDKLKQLLGGQGQSQVIQQPLPQQQPQTSPNDVNKQNQLLALQNLMNQYK